MSLIPAFEIGIWNAWILMLIVVFHAVLSFVMIILSKGDLKKRLSEIPTNPPFNKTENRIKSLSNVFIILLLVYSVFLPLQIGTIWLYTGLAVFSLGFIARQVTIVPWVTTPLDKPVTAGLYRYSRHPIYLTMIWQLIGISVAAASLFFLLLTIVLIFLINYQLIPEERFCLLKYGNTYDEYMNRTPRWIGLPKSG